ncbi:hypothetical protein OHB24_14575 [Kribbella sp. NBC_00482]|uniref:hypothetical protein n=1 Tax=Kribbella sp. NBC_00482 TaxID=2975968 RepID=UPI002E19E32D
MDLSKLEFFGVAVTSGLVAGIANQLAKFGHDWLTRRGVRKLKETELAHQETTQARQLEHQETIQARDLEHKQRLQAEEREHQTAVRREAAFFEARKELVPLAVAVLDWVDWQYGKEHGDEADYHHIQRKPAKLADASEAIAALQRIAGEHPSKMVRDRAAYLKGSLDSAYNMPNPDGVAEPDSTEMSRWLREADELVHAHHDPDYPPIKVSVVD